jgi:hypothetical protein
MDGCKIKGAQSKGLRYRSHEVIIDQHLYYTDRVILFELQISKIVYSEIFITASIDSGTSEAIDLFCPRQDFPTCN